MIPKDVLQYTVNYQRRYVPTRAIAQIVVTIACEIVLCNCFAAHQGFETQFGNYLLGINIDESTTSMFLGL